MYKTNRWTEVVMGVTNMASTVKVLCLALALMGTASAQSCGGSYSVTAGTVGQFSSPNYPYSYFGPLDCVWSFKAPAGYNLRLTCNPLTVGCYGDYVSVSKSGDLAFADAQRLCGSGSLTADSTSTALTMKLHADLNPQGGFTCSIQAIPATTSTTTSTTTPTTTTNTTATSSTCQCGIKNTNRIVGGVETGIHEWPWQVALYNKAGGYQFCGGTLISPNWVLTASHCVDGETASNIVLGFGLHDKTQTSAAGATLRQADRIIMNSAYDANTVNNDIALIHFATPVTYTNEIRPACLPSAYSTKNWSGTNATVTGWGTTTFGGIDSNKLLEVNLPVLDTTDCQKYLGTRVNTNMICTYTAGKDSCQGDSGGPLNYQDPTTGRVSVIGIVSWGVGCADVNRPGVYTRVSNYLSWIKQQTGETFCSP